MTPSSATGSKTSPITWVGLFIALFGILIVRWAVSLFYPGFSFTATLWKESFIWLCVIALLLIIRRGEHLPFSSVGIGTSTWKKSILWGGHRYDFVVGAHSLCQPIGDTAGSSAWQPCD